MNCAIPTPLHQIPALVLLLCTSIVSFAQQEDTATAGNTLSSVEVKAYGQVRRLRDVPAAVGFVSTQTLSRFGTGSVVQAVNTVPGVRMEERSPGSFRLNIRGSSLRSPFGVRNVKIYFNDLPFTDPGGQSYLNGLGYYNIGSLEILKGPGSSLYGAGTGGVLLIESLAPAESTGVIGEYTLGSYGLHNAYASVTAGTDANRNRIGFQHQAGNGYRYHSEMKRKVLSWTGNHRMTEKGVLKTTFLYSDLFYETPGALTRTEYTANPKAFRPRAGGFPSAEQARAAIYQKSFLAGASYTHQISSTLSNQSAAYGMFTDLQNATIRNYSRATEPHTGGRTVFNYRRTAGGAYINVLLGGELQKGFATSTAFKNMGGSADSLQSEDDIRIRQSFVFLQVNLALKGWELTAGGSLNYSTLRFRRLAPAPLPEQTRKLNDHFTPRIALARKLNGTTLYASVSKGFSPPTSNELLPTGSSINLALQAEEGTNYDLGARGTLAGNLSFDINAFFLRLKNTIIQRRDAGGGDYYINAGTSQKGLETSLNWTFLQQTPVFRNGVFWVSHTYHRFRYRDTVQATGDIFGKALPNVAPHTLSSGLDLFARNGLQATITHYYSGSLPLNDANTGFADAFHLLGAKIGYEKFLRNWDKLRLVVGVDNLLDQRYSLGNDINGFGGRFFNAAPGRNFFATLALQLFTSKQKPLANEGL